MLLDADAKSANGDSLGDGEHERRARGHLSDAIASGGHDPDPVDVGASGVDLDVQSLVGEEAEPSRDHFAELVSSREPAELHVEDGKAVHFPPRGEAGAAGGEEGMTEELASSHAGGEGIRAGGGASSRLKCVASGRDPDHRSGLPAGYTGFVGENR